MTLNRNNLHFEWYFQTIINTTILCRLADFLNNRDIFYLKRHLNPARITVISNWFRTKRSYIDLRSFDSFSQWNVKKTNAKQLYLFIVRNKVNGSFRVLELSMQRGFLDLVWKTFQYLWKTKPALFYLVKFDLVGFCTDGFYKKQVLLMTF